MFLASGWHGGNSSQSHARETRVVIATYILVRALSPITATVVFCAEKVINPGLDSGRSHAKRRAEPEDNIEETVTYYRLPLRITST